MIDEPPLGYRIDSLDPSLDPDQRAQLQQQIDWWMESQRGAAAEERRLMRQLNEFGLRIWP
jgi:hypothetical protein